MNAFGLALALAVGMVLGLLGGGGSILALPIFLYVFKLPVEPAIAMSLAVVSMSSFVGFLGHWRQRSVSFRIGVPFGAVAIVTAFVTASLTHFVPDALQLGLFAAFAGTSAIVMLRDALRPERPAVESEPPARKGRFTWLVALQACAVGALTALIGAGGGFVIVPALVYLAGVPVKAAVGSSLLIITLNALAGFLGYVGRVEVDWRLVLSFTGIAAVGAVIGARLSRRLSARRIKLAFALLIIALGTYLILRRVL
ncbi:MAG TPA: sulfite exporter TauE/SafE family protein [Gemmatimonadaceae bacterium]